MATNNFKPFATAANANVTAQADWESLPALLSGFTAGKASSAQVNKAIRQASFIAAALAQYTANKSGLDVLDDGDLNGFIAKMSAAFGKDFQALDATLTALAGLTTGANKLPYFTGTDTASQTDLTSVGRDIIGKGTIADILTYLGLGNLPTFGAAASKGVATNADMQAGTSTDLLPTVAAVISLFSKRTFAQNDFIRIPDVPGGLMIQWGSLLDVKGSNVITSTLTFPQLFPNACFAVVPVSTSSSSSGGMAGVQIKTIARSSSDIFIYERDSGAIASHDVQYIAIGW